MEDVTGPVLDIADLRLQRGARAILSGVTLSVARRRAGRDHGTVRLRQDNPSCARLPGSNGFKRADCDRRRHARRRRRPSRHRRSASCAARSAWCSSSTALFEHLTALDNVLSRHRLHAHGLAPALAKTRALDLLTTFGVEHRAAALPRQLSGGEAQRVAIASELAVDSAGAVDGRADGIARSGAPGRARSAAARAAAPATVRLSSPRTTTTSHATGPPTFYASRMGFSSSA